MDELELLKKRRIGAEQFITAPNGEIEFVVLPADDWFRIINVIHNFGFNIEEGSQKKSKDNDIWSKRKQLFKQLLNENMEYDLTVDPTIDISKLAKEVNDVIL